MMQKSDKVRGKSCHNNLNLSKKIKFFFGSPFPWFPIRVPIYLRLVSDDSPFVLRSIFDRSSIPERRMNGEWTEDERESIENRTKDERRTIRKIYRRNCWADCEAVSLLMIFQELIKVDFGTFLFDDGPHNTRQNLRHINILLPNAEHCQTYCLKIISLQPHENQEESNAEKKIKLNS